MSMHVPLRCGLLLDFIFYGNTDVKLSSMKGLKLTLSTPLPLCDVTFQKEVDYVLCLRYSVSTDDACQTAGSELLSIC